MENAYDFKALGQRLKAKVVPVLLDAAEKAVDAAYGEVKGWIKESAAISPNKIDDIVAPFIDQADQVVKPQIDKIDGKVTQNL